MLFKVQREKSFLLTYPISILTFRSFYEMNRLLELNLQGNLLKTLPDLAFQNLHRLRSLNLAFNRIDDFNFGAFENVGNLAHLFIDVSHNRLEVLRVNRTFVYPLNNIMSLDFSHNNISVIDVTFFEPVANELKILNMSRNILREISPDTIGQLTRLISVDLSYNRVSLIELNTFMAARRLKSVDLRHNKLEDLHPTLFNGKTRLCYVDVSVNSLSRLPEQLFQRTSLQIFKAARNKLTEIPVKALNPVQSTLRLVKMHTVNIHILMTNFEAGKSSISLLNLPG